MTFGRLRKIFCWKNHTQNVVGKLAPNPFTKTLKLSISLNQQSQMF